MQEQTQGFYIFGPFHLDAGNRLLLRAGEPVPLTLKAVETLLVLVENAGRVVTKDELMRGVWPDTFVEEGNLAKNVFALRKALGAADDGQEYIETLAKRGYRFRAAVSAPPVSAANLSGKKISHYRVLQILGAGSMGVVYKAEDLKLGRRVAMKFLPEELAADAGALSRFEREARAVSALDHPNICVIHEFGEHEGQPFLVMPLLEGQTLRERIEAGPIPTDELVRIAVQVTEGLESAHRHGIVHRDIKPANLFVTNRGEVRILDFGIAKLLDSSDDGYAEPGSAYKNVELTRTGAKMGTASYMSPEQVRGERLDARSDLFSLGLVLYEMATRQRAFPGGTVAVVHESILTRTPPPARTVNPRVAQRLEAILEKALQKDRNRRYQTAADLGTDLRRLRARPAAMPTNLRVAMVCVVVLLAAGAGFWWTKRQPTSMPELKQRPLTHNSSDRPVGTAAISPDGRSLAYSDMRGIHLLTVDSGEVRNIPLPKGFESGERAAWSVGPWLPNGTKFLVHTRPVGQDAKMWSSEGSSIWSVSMPGVTPPQKIRDNAQTWTISPNGSFMSFDTHKGPLGDREIWIGDPSGEHARKLFETDEETSINGLEWSPHGQRVIYIKGDKTGEALLTRDLDGGSPRVLMSFPGTLRDYHWMPDGRIWYAVAEFGPTDSTCNFWQIRIDERTGEMQEKPRKLTNWAGFCMANLTASADGKRLAFTRWAAQRNVYVADLEPTGMQIGATRRLTLSDSFSDPVDWTPDSRSVIFQSDRNGRWAIFRQSIDSDTAQTFSKEQSSTTDARLSPDGRWLLYRVPPQRGTQELPSIMRVAVSGGPSQFVATARGRFSCAKSPATACALAEPSDDGKQLVFSYLDPMRGRGAEFLRLNMDPSSESSWELSNEGSRIAFLAGPNQRVQIVSLNGEARRDFAIQGWNGQTRLAWTPNGNGLFVSRQVLSAALLFHLDLLGNPQMVWKQDGDRGIYGIPSPDGRHLAIMRWTVTSNAWMLEDF